MLCRSLRNLPLTLCTELVFSHLHLSDRCFNLNKILRLLQEEKNVIWRTPKDATAASAEGQGLDYEQPKEAEIAAKGSGITPQMTFSMDKDSSEIGKKQEISDENALSPKQKKSKNGCYP